MAARITGRLALGVYVVNGVAALDVDTAIGAVVAAVTGRDPYGLIADRQRSLSVPVGSFATLAPGHIVTMLQIGHDAQD
ncbi:MAG: hypothetical protein OXB92_07735 [Acidimicrobiaceae bacterium]|nr:hypothetical protein [Acidimicrobiaceae bacterium]